VLDWELRSHGRNEAALSFPQAARAGVFAAGTGREAALSYPQAARA